jgi:hypothetical protein
VQGGSCRPWGAPAPPCPPGHTPHRLPTPPPARPAGGSTAALAAGPRSAPLDCPPPPCPPLLPGILLFYKNSSCKGKAASVLLKDVVVQAGSSKSKQFSLLQPGDMQQIWLRCLHLEDKARWVGAGGGVACACACMPGAGNCWRGKAILRPWPVAWPGLGGYHVWHCSSSASACGSTAPLKAPQRLAAACLPGRPRRTLYAGGLPGQEPGAVPQGVRQAGGAAGQGGPGHRRLSVSAWPLPRAAPRCLRAGPGRQPCCAAGRACAASRQASSERCSRARARGLARFAQAPLRRWMAAAAGQGRCSIVEARGPPPPSAP